MNSEGSFRSILSLSTSRLSINFRFMTCTSVMRLLFFFCHSASTRMSRFTLRCFYHTKLNTVSEFLTTSRKITLAHGRAHISEPDSTITSLTVTRLLTQSNTTFACDDAYREDQCTDCAYHNKRKNVCDTTLDSNQYRVTTSLKIWTIPHFTVSESESLHPPDDYVVRSGSRSSARTTGT